MSSQYEQRTATGVTSALDICLDLRRQGFWSFRGQRDASWEVRLHGDDRLDDVTDFFDEFKLRCKQFPAPHYLEEHKEWRWLFYAEHYRRGCSSDEEFPDPQRVAEFINKQWRSIRPRQMWT